MKIVIPLKLLMSNFQTLTLDFQSPVINKRNPLISNLQIATSPFQKKSPSTRNSVIIS